MTGNEDKMPGWLGQGGQKQARRAGAATLYDIHGPERERATATDYRAAVTGILDPKLNLTLQERAIGQCYGAYYQQAHTGGSTEFLREYVDGGGVNGGGYSEKQAHICAMVVTGQAALTKMRAVRYRKPKPRTAKGARRETKPGRFLPIPALLLIDAMCVHGHSIETVAIRFQWFMLEKRHPRDPWRDSKIVTQWRPRKHIVDNVRTILSNLGEAWNDAGMHVPYHFGTLEVE